jgi:hypothetical protein
VGGTHYRVSAKRKRRTVAVNESKAEDEEQDIIMGQTVTAGAYQWRRIEGITEDKRVEPHFDTTFKTNIFNEDALEIDIFRAIHAIRQRPVTTHSQRECRRRRGQKSLVGMAY